MFLSKKKTSLKRILRFAATVTVAHVVTYIGGGVLAYIFLTREFFDSSDTLVAQVLRTPGDLELWPHVIRWMIPFQVARGNAERISHLLTDAFSSAPTAQCG
jgi:hypothetical protein